MKNKLNAIISSIKKIGRFSENQIEFNKVYMVDPKSLVFEKTKSELYEAEPEKIKALAESIKKHGFYASMPVTANAKNEIIAGHCRTLAALQLGLAQIPVMYIDFGSDEQNELNWALDEQMLRRGMGEKELIKSFLLKEELKQKALAEGKSISEFTNAAYAAAFHVSERQISKMRNTLATATADEKDQLLNGELTLNKLYKSKKQDVPVPKKNTTKTIDVTSFIAGIKFAALQFRTGKELKNILSDSRITEDFSFSETENKKIQLMMQENSLF